MSPEAEKVLTMLATALSSGAAAVLANSRAVRRRVRKLERVAKKLGEGLDEVRAGHKKLEAEQAERDAAKKLEAQRQSWCMGAVQALLAALRIRVPPPPLAVALDAESTAGTPARAR